MVSDAYRKEAEAPGVCDCSVDGGTDIENAITVTEIVPNATEAYREAERLNKLNGATGSRYFVQATRYYPEGRSGSKTLAKS